MNFVLNMEIPDFINQFLKIKEKELEQKVWELWLAKYPHMTKDTFVSYEEMLDTAKHDAQGQEEQVQGGLYADQVGLF